MLIPNLSRVLRAKVDTAAGGTVAVIAASGTTTIRVIAMDLNMATSTTVVVKSGTTALTGAMTMTNKQWPVNNLGDRVLPWFVCTAGDALNLTFGGAVQCSGVILYTQE